EGQAGGLDGGDHGGLLLGGDVAGDLGLDGADALFGGGVLGQLGVGHVLTDDDGGGRSGRGGDGRGDGEGERRGGGEVGDAHGGSFRSPHDERLLKARPGGPRLPDARKHWGRGERR